MTADFYFFNTCFFLVFCGLCVELFEKIFVLKDVTADINMIWPEEYLHLWKLGISSGESDTLDKCQNTFLSDWRFLNFF